MTYLGMPLSIKAPTRADYMPLLHKLETRLEGWKARFISRAGKLQLVKTVLSAIPNYFMSCFSFPRWLISRIDAIRRQFLWSKAQSVRPIHLLNWKVVCLPTKCGGLGVTDLHLHNVALLLRWWCRLFDQNHKLWSTYAAAIYGKRRNTDGPITFSPSGSFFWSAIHKLKPIFHSCAQITLLSGLQTSFWYDGWAGQPLAAEKSSTLPRRLVSVHEARGCFHQLLPGPLTLQQNRAYEEMTRFAPVQGIDVLKWNLSQNGRYTAGSIYMVLSQGGKTKTLCTSLWKAKVPPTMKLFFFLMLQNRILTHDVMLRRNLYHVPGCILCATQAMETVMHLFFECPFATAIWALVSNSLGHVALTTAETPILTFLASAPNRRDIRTRWTGLFIVTSSFLWRERNDRTFRQVSTTQSVLAARIIQHAALCLKFC